MELRMLLNIKTEFDASYATAMTRSIMTHTHGGGESMSLEVCASSR